MPEKVVEWVEWEAPFNRIRRKLLRTESGMKIIQKREQKRDGEWKPYPKDSEGRWSDVNADFPEDEL